jgi:aryl-alcohol dehydrogenase-like predicted oxidoreductase
LASKVANAMGPGPHESGLSRKWLMKACDDSLRRLGTEFIDIYYLHKEDHSVPLAETVRALSDLVRQGKIRHFGVSNYRSWRVAEICRLCDELGIDRPVVSQPYYNAMNRMPEVEHLPACGFYGLGVASYSPLARGVLTAKYEPGQAPPDDTRAGRADRRIMQTEWREESLIIARKIRDHAAARGLTPVQFAVRWVLNNKLVTAAIAGPRTFEQWQAYMAALDADFTTEDEALVDQLVPAGHPSTPGYNDPAYPLEGRVVRTAD